MSSGWVLGVHCPLPMVLSLGKFSLVTPISTLEAAPAKINSDLFCAFQPKRLTVWSLALVLNLPLMPVATIAPLGVLAERLAAVLALARSVASGVFSTKPSPNSGIGMRNITLLL